MSTDVNVLEDRIEIKFEEFDPSVLNPDFLRYNRVVPKGWRLSDKPMCTEAFSTVEFEDFLRVHADGNGFTIDEKLAGKPRDKMMAPRVAQALVKRFPDRLSVGVVLTFRGHFAMDKQQVFDVLTNNVIAKGPWLKFHGNQGIGAVRFSYPIGEDSVFQLTVEPGTLEMEDKGMKPGLIVEGRFRRRVTGESSEANLESAVNLIRNCK